MTRTREHSWQDPRLTAAAARDVDGLTFLRALAAGEVPPAPIAGTLGFTVLEVESGRIVFGLEPAEFHFNPIGTAYTSLDLSVKFLRGLDADSGPVRCEGLVVHLGGRTALAEARLHDGAGRLCAHAASSCMIFRPAG